MLSTQSIDKKLASEIFVRATHFLENSSECGNLLLGKTLVNLFFEHSTRTRVSFELAALKLGARVINIDVATSSLNKGESLVDMALTINSMNPDFLVIRHQESGMAALLAKYFTCRVINGGDGTNEHPTQALLDSFTIKRELGSIAGKKIAIIGDITNSRVARSNITLLTTLGAELRLAGPPPLLPFYSGKIKHYHNLLEAIDAVDVIITLRLQKERMKMAMVASEEEYYRFYGLGYHNIGKASPDVIILHPGPINRKVEIDPDLAYDTRYSKILTQVTNGVAIRMAILSAL